MALSDLWNKVTSLLPSKEVPKSNSPFENCKHEYEHTGQQWVPVDKKLFRLVDHQHCVKCGVERFLEIK